MKTVVIDNDKLSITLTQGDTDTAVVTFSGVELAFGNAPQEEFVKTLDGAVHTQFFVIDKVRSWYNATAEDIVSLLSPLLARYRKVVTLGNSMGGFGAVYFASRLPTCSTAISFVPQFSVNSVIVPRETRWREYRSRIESWTVRHAMEDASESPEYLLFFGKEEPRDLDHLALFREHATTRTSIFSLDGARHGAARYLKQNGQLRALLDVVIVHGQGGVGAERLLVRHEVPHTYWRASAAAQQ